MESSAIVLGNSDEGVSAVAFSRDGKWAATGGGDNLIRIWNLRSNQCEAVLEGTHYDHVISGSLAFSPDGNSLLCSNYSGSLFLYDLASQKLLQRDEAHLSSPRIQFGRSGDLALTNSYFGMSGEPDEVMQVWNVRTWTAITAFRGRCGDLSSDGKAGLFAKEDYSLELWSFEPNKCRPIANLEGHTSYIDSISISPNGKFAISTDFGGSFFLWDLTKLTFVDLGLQTPPESVASIRQSYARGQAVFSQNGELVSVYGNSLCECWDINTHERIATQNHDNPIVDCGFRTDGTVLSVDQAGRIEHWSPSISRTYDLGFEITSATKISPNGNYILAPLKDQDELYLWNAEKPECISRLGRPLYAKYDRTSGPIVDFSRDARRCLVGCVGENCEESSSIIVIDTASATTHQLPEEHFASIHRLAISSDAAVAASVDSYGQLRTWDLETQCAVSVRQIPKFSEASHLSMSSDGKYVVLVIDDVTSVLEFDTLEIADEEQNASTSVTDIELENGSYSQHKLNFRKLRNHPFIKKEGPILALGGSGVVAIKRDDSVEIWDIARATSLYSVKVPHNHVPSWSPCACALSNAGEFVAIVLDYDLWIWRKNSPDPQIHFELGWQVTYLQFDANIRLIAVSENGLMRIWDTHDLL